MRFKFRKQIIFMSALLVTMFVTKSFVIKAYEQYEGSVSGKFIALPMNEVSFEHDVSETMKFAEEYKKSLEPKKVYIGDFLITAYCSCSTCCGIYASNRPVDVNGNQIVKGASGEILTSGYSIAVDTRVIPFGTKIIINDKGYLAQDVGGAIKGNRIDVYFSSHSEALSWGKDYYSVYMLVEE